MLDSVPRLGYPGKLVGGSCNARTTPAVSPTATRPPLKATRALSVPVAPLTQYLSASQSSELDGLGCHARSVPSRWMLSTVVSKSGASCVVWEQPGPVG